MPTLSIERTSNSYRSRGPSVHQEVENATDLRLANRIRERIYLRLGWRIRDLKVQLDGQQVVLSGHCATYYSKQMAQHVALGLLEDERLVNAIVVSGPN